MVCKPEAIALAILCASCAPAYVRRQPALADARPERSVVCATTPECDRLWSDARFWIGEHSARGVKLQTREALSTGCGGDAPAPCLELVRVPLAAEREEIRITVECSGASTCVPDAAETRRELIDYLIGFPPVEE
jgi:hypothetical protein